MKKMIALLVFTSFLFVQEVAKAQDSTKREKDKTEYVFKIPFGVALDVRQGFVLDCGIIIGNTNQMKPWEVTGGFSYGLTKMVGPALSASAGCYVTPWCKIGGEFLYFYKFTYDTRIGHGFPWAEFFKSKNWGTIKYVGGATATFLVPIKNKCQIGTKMAVGVMFYPRGTPQQFYSIDLNFRWLFL